MPSKASPTKIFSLLDLQLQFSTGKTHPADGSGGKGRRRSEADSSDGTGELHGGMGASGSGGDREAVFVIVSPALRWAKKAEEHVIV